MLELSAEPKVFIWSAAVGSAAAAALALCKEKRGDGEERETHLSSRLNARLVTVPIRTVERQCSKQKNEKGRIEAAGFRLGSNFPIQMMMSSS